MEIKSEIAGKQATLGELNHVLEDAGFVRWAWDYNHVTYDYKLVDKSSKTTYYLRLQGNVVNGYTEDHDAEFKLEEPHIGKHLFPHGIDYDAVIPSNILSIAKDKINLIKGKL